MNHALLLHIKFDPDRPDGGTVIKNWKSESLTGHAPHIMSVIDWEFEKHLHLNMLYKKRLLDS